MIYAEILAGGKGTRMGNTEMPKQFLNIGKKPIIIHTIEKFLLNTRIDKIVVVSPEQWVDHTKNILSKYLGEESISRIDIAVGGSDRNESIKNGILHIEKTYGLNEDDIVITHDAVRPFVTSRIIDENISMTELYGATDTVISAYDTIVKSENGDMVDEIPVRDFMYQGQTPQGFNAKKFLHLYDGLDSDEKNILTDAAKIFTINNHNVKLVQGEIFNMKITSPYDLKMANMIVEIEKSI